MDGFISFLAYGMVYKKCHGHRYKTPPLLQSIGKTVQNGNFRSKCNILNIHFVCQCSANIYNTMSIKTFQT